MRGTNRKGIAQQHSRQRYPAKRRTQFIAALAALVVLAGLATIALRRAATACGSPDFNPGRIAYLERAGWEAYYDRNWLRVFGLMVQMNREQFCMPLPTAVAAAIDIVQTSIAFAPVDNDVPAATAYLQNFYAKARRTRGLQADAKTLAALEMDYWVVHRRLAIARKQAPNHEGDIGPMVDALAKLHAALFDAPPEAIRRSAELRAEAARTVDQITGGYSAQRFSIWPLNIAIFGFWHCSDAFCCERGDEKRGRERGEHLSGVG